MKFSKNSWSIFSTIASIFLIPIALGTILYVYGVHQTEYETQRHAVVEGKWTMRVQSGTPINSAADARLRATTFLFDSEQECRSMGVIVYPRYSFTCGNPDSKKDALWTIMAPAGQQTFFLQGIYESVAACEADLRTKSSSDGAPLECVTLGTKSPQ